MNEHTLMVIQKGLMANIFDLSEMLEKADGKLLKDVISRELKEFRDALRKVDGAISDILLKEDPEFNRLIAEEEKIEEANKLQRAQITTVAAPNPFKNI